MSEHPIQQWGSSAGAVVSAGLASMCCIVPLTFGILGLSGAGLSAFFEPLRPYFLGLSAALLALAFYFAFRRPAATSEACSIEARRPSRLTTPLLWVATAAVIGLAFFPSIVTRAVGGAGELSGDGAVPSAVVVLQVEGMTCESCAPEVRRHLLAVPGVLDAAVSYERQLAEVRVRSELGPEISLLLEAVRASGYAATIGEVSQ